MGDAFKAGFTLMDRSHEQFIANTVAAGFSKCMNPSYSINKSDIYMHHNINIENRRHTLTFPKKGTR